MPALENDVFLRALAREPTPYTPVWLMRQAGRYLPEYNATRAKAGSFLALAKTPSLATEVTLQPLARFPLDAAILFSDILTVPDAMGLGLYFAEGEGPRFERTVADEAAIDRLAVPDMAKLRYVFDAVREIKHALHGRVPLIGFSGSPFTLACYMIEGAGSPDFATVRRMAYGRPDLLQRIVAINARAVAAYLNEQIAAGADAVMIFDTWGGLLSSSAYRAFSLASMRAVLAALAPAPDGRTVPTIAFTKGGGQWLDELADCGASCIGVDWTVDIKAARARIGARVALQGNLDPLVLLTDPETVDREAVAVVRAAGPAPGHVFNLGHGIVPATPPDNVAALIGAVHRESRAARAGA
ncbi:MAG: uroporphyrinogen decarboxylase [Betaproteobacteria bacterium]